MQMQLYKFQYFHQQLRLYRRIQHQDSKNQQQRQYFLRIQQQEPNELLCLHQQSLGIPHQCQFLLMNLVFSLRMQPQKNLLMPIQSHLYLHTLYYSQARCLKSKDFGLLRFQIDQQLQLILRLQLDRQYLLMSRAFNPSILHHIDCIGDNLEFELRSISIKDKLSFPTYKIKVMILFSKLKCYNQNLIRSVIQRVFILNQWVFLVIKSQNSYSETTPSPLASARSIIS